MPPAHVLARVLPAWRRHVTCTLIGGPADGLALRVPRPVPPWLFAATRYDPDQNEDVTMLAQANDPDALCVVALGLTDDIARYRLAGKTSYLHAPA